MPGNRKEALNGMEASFRQALDFIDRYHSFLLLTHRSPDGDAVGSTLGLAHFLKGIGKQVYLANQDHLPRRLQFLPGSEWFQTASEINRQITYEAVITLDSADEQQLGTAIELIPSGMPVLNFDHHYTNTRFGLVNAVNADAASSTQVVYELIHFAGGSLTSDIALCLYTGLVTDTGGFRHSNTTSDVHQMAAELLTFDIRPAEISDRVLISRTLSSLYLTQAVLKGLQVDDSGQLAWVTVTREQMNRCGATDEDLESLIEYPRSIDTVEIAALFKEREDGSIKVSLRSKQRVDVSQVALEFGGGGHQRAAGCTLDAPLEQAVSQLTHRLRKEIE